MNSRNLYGSKSPSSINDSILNKAIVNKSTTATKTENSITFTNKRRRNLSVDRATSK